MIAVNVRLEGHEQLQRWLTNLGPKLAKKITRKALREGCKVVAKEVKVTVPVDSGELKKSIAVRVVKKRKKDWIRFRIHTGDAFYARFLEYGFFKRPVRRTEAGKFISIGRNRDRQGKAVEDATWIPPRPFMRQAFERKQDESLKAITQVFRREIEANFGKTTNVNEGADGLVA